MKKCLIKLYNYSYDVIRRVKLDIRYRFKVLSPEKTVARIQKTGCSLVRYGDGEFGLITKSNNPDFQQNDEGLSQRLAEICACEDPRVLVCIPHNFKSTKDCNDFARKFWDWWIWENDNLEKVSKLLKLNPWRARIFGDAQITRPYMDWKDKSRTKERFENLKSLWDGRDVLIVEGAQTMLGTGNDLLSNTKSIQRLICPAKNAYSSYQKIFAEAKKLGKGKLILIALGPTATVLAYDLAMEGIQALDIGHIDIEYEWYRMGATEKVPIAGKHIQELHNSQAEMYELDVWYLNQIINKIE